MPTILQDFRKDYESGFKNEEENSEGEDEFWVETCHYITHIEESIHYGSDSKEESLSIEELFFPEEGEDADLAKTMRPECQLTLRSGAYIPERQPLKESEKEKSKAKGRGKEHEDGGETSEKPKFTVGDYKVVAHLRKIPALLSVFDALMMSQELRNVLVYALQNPEKFQAYFAERNMQEATYTSCTASISFTMICQWAQLNTTGHCI